MLHSSCWWRIELRHPRNVINPVAAPIATATTVSQNSEDDVLYHWDAVATEAYLSISARCRRALRDAASGWRAVTFKLIVGQGRREKSKTVTLRDLAPSRRRRAGSRVSTRLAGRLISDGIPCPSAHDPDRNRHRHGPAWQESAVPAILANPRYTGRQVWNRQRQGKS
jgi:hypothetical protein